MKSAFLVLSFLAAAVSFAHDEGHGPKLTDTGKFGGVVSPVIAAKDAKLGAKAALVHKAELVRSDDGTIRVYLYDKEMKPLDLKAFAPEAQAYLEFKKNKKWVKTPFQLKQEEGALKGTAPKATSKPFNIDVYPVENGKKLLTAFDNLD